MLPSAAGFALLGTASTCCFGNPRRFQDRGGIVRRTERIGGRDDAKTKRQAGKFLRQKNEL